MADWYCSSVAYAAITQFAISTAYTVGQIVRQLAAPTVGNERAFRCTTAGTSGASEPTWVITKAATTTSGTAVFTECTGNTAYGWSAAAARVGTLGSAYIAAGDYVWVAHNHAETQASALSLGYASGTAGGSVICVNAAGSVPPVAADLRATATVTTTGSFGITITGNVYFYGVTFNASSGGSTNTVLTMGTAGCVQMFEACVLKQLSTGTFATIATASDSFVALENTSLFFAVGNVQNFAPARGIVKWRNSTALTGAGSSAASSLIQISAAGANITCENVDFSTVPMSRSVSTASLGVITMIDCKHPSGVVVQQLTSTQGVFTYVATDTANAYRFGQYTQAGILEADATVYRSGGAAYDVTALSWLCTIAAACSYHVPFETAPMVRWNALTGSAKTVTVEALLLSATLLTTSEVWLDVSSLGASGSPLGTGTRGRTNPMLLSGTTLPTSTEAWTAPLRANGNAYALNTVYRVSSNPGRVFYCSTLGTSAGSEPAGLATAVDGDAVTDGSCVFRAARRVKLQVSITPQKIGPVRAAVRSVQSSMVLYVDPMMVLS